MQYSDEKVFDDKWTGKDFNEARNRARLFYKTIRLKEIVEYFNYMPYEDRYDQLLYDGYTRDDVLVLRTNFNFEGYERYVLLYKLVDGRWAVMAEGGL